MPFNKLHVPRDLPPSLCKALSAALHDSLVATCGVKPDDDFTLIQRYDPEDMLFNPEFFGPRDPARTIVVEIALLGGRSDAQKEELYRDLRERFADAGHNPRDSIVFLLENNAIDWSFGPEGSVKTVLGL